MNVRPVTAADASAWLSLRRELWPGTDGDHASEIARFLAGDAREPLAVLLAEDEGARIVGFIELSIRAYAAGCVTDRVAFVEGWYVGPDARRRGVGRALIAAAEAWARAQGCSELASDAELNNESSAAAHVASGFVETGLVRCFRKELGPNTANDESQMPVNQLRLYGEFASWWPLMSAPVEYTEEAAFYRHTFQVASRRPIHSLLELGSGGGNNAFHLKAHYDEVVLVDLSPAMLEVSRSLNPELEHHQGDMRTVRLGRQFDAVFVQDAVCYMTSESDLRDAMSTAFAHCKPGGAAIFAPDYVCENFQPSAEHGGHDDATRGMRWVGWTWDPDPADTTYFADYAYLMREADGSMHVAHDRHVEGLFPRETWLRLLERAGFQPRVVPLELTEIETQTLEVFVCVRPVRTTDGP